MGSLRNDAFKQYINKAIAKNRIPHATLLLGPQGVGMLGHAIWMAAKLMCMDQTTDEPCGNCSSCKKIEKRIHPDLHFTFPVINSGSSGKKITSDLFMEQWRDYLQDREFVDYFEWMQLISGESNKRGNITKDECDRILHKSQMKSFEGNRKVFIIWMADLIGSQGNRLLKLLEEPQPDTIFILIAESSENLLPTIVSRVQTFKFYAWSREQIESLLRSQDREISDIRISEIVNISDGNAHMALKLLDSPQSALSDNLLELLRIGYSANGQQAADWADTLSSYSREHLMLFFRYGLKFLEECLKAKMVGEAYTKKLTRDEQKAANWVLDKFSFDQLELFIRVLNKNVNFVDRNVNLKILMMATAVKVMNIFHGKEIRVA